ncbi:MAG: hypothetical protein M0Q19_09485 [Candidatus Cloacimonetes bacterium]|jgi:uncharacterized protein (UPF0332 family)|nr:hypothetical protein [Candidatus Cloacimonadota bacterium]
MVFDWTGYLTLAKFLHMSASVSYPEEAAKRAAVSRAYYAAFCYARNYAEHALGFIPSHRARDHGDLIIHYEAAEIIHPALSGIADALDELLEWRRTCDYDDEVVCVTDLDALVDHALDDAQNIINTLI